MTSKSNDAPAKANDINCVRFARRLIHATVVALILLILGLATMSKWTTLVETQADRLDGTVTQGDFEDYVAFYAAGKLVLDGQGADLYDTEIIAAKEYEIMGRPVGGTGSLAFFNPPFVALLFAPLALLPVGVAGVLVFLGNCFLVLGVAEILRRILGIRGLLPITLSALAALSLNSVFWLTGHGQFSMLLLIGFLGFFWFQRRGKPGLSGLALVLLLVKPQMAVLPILLLLWRRDWRALASFSAVAVALVVISVAVSGPMVLWEYPSFAIRSTGWEMELGINVDRMYGWNGFFATLVSNRSPIHVALTVSATVVTVGLVLRAFRNAPPASSQYALASGAMVAGAILINPHVYLQDTVLMVQVLVLGYVGTRESGWPDSAWVGISALVWLAQENTDRMLNEFSVNVVTLLLIGLLTLLLLGFRKAQAEQSIVPQENRVPQSAVA